VLAFRQPTPPAEAGAHADSHGFSEEVAETEADDRPDVSEFEEEFADHALEPCGCGADGGSECAKA
jgi:hypothetical protein